MHAARSRVFVRKEMLGVAFAAFAVHSVPVVTIVSSTWDNDGNVQLETKAFLHSLAKAEPGPVHFIFVADKAAEEHIVKWFDGCKASRFSYEIRHIPVAHIAKEIAAYHLRGRGPLDHHAGVASVAKFFLASILPDHNKAIVYDTDVMLRRPISELWRAFDSFTPKQMWASTVYNNRGAVCSCLSLFNLEAMRQFGWTLKSRKLRHLFNGINLESGCVNKGTAQCRYYESGHGDQALNTLVYHAWPELFGTVSKTWILNKCQNYFGITNPASVGDLHLGGAQEWGAVHFNCGSPKSGTPWHRVAMHFYAQVRGRDWRMCVP